MRAKVGLAMAAVASWSEARAGGGLQHRFRLTLSHAAHAQKKNRLPADRFLNIARFSAHYRKARSEARIRTNENKTARCEWLVPTGPSRGGRIGAPPTPPVTRKVTIDLYHDLRNRPGSFTRSFTRAGSLDMAPARREERRRQRKSPGARPGQRIEGLRTAHLLTRRSAHVDNPSSDF